MSTGLRGVKFHFEPGEHVLCFEPDSSKARVLYEAKILELQIGHTGFGKRYPEYHIHFQGWKTSWDRLVPETFVIKNSDSNRSLMRRLAATAKHVRSNKMRRRRIDMLLQHHFRRRPTFNTSDSDSSEDSSEETENDAAIQSGEEDTSEQTTEEEETEGGSSEDEKENNQEDGFSDDADNVGEGAGSLDVDIPKNLRQKLEDDCSHINSQNKLLTLPAQTNVLTILEAYLKNFAINQLCATERKQKQNIEAVPSAHESIEVGKEIMDSLRILFDFTLPKILLYDPEIEQYDTCMSDYDSGKLKPSPPNSCQKNGSAEETKCRSPRNTRFRAKSPTEPPAKVPKISPKPVKKEEESDEEFPARRMTRHSFAEELKRVKSPAPTSKKSTNNNDKSHENGHAEECGVKKEEEKVTKCESGRRRRDSRSRRTSSSSQVIPSPGAASPGRASPPPATNVSESASSTNTEQRADAESRRQAAVGDIFSWQLIPSEILKSLPVQPSVLYGSHHLLRMFVKLPELVSSMNIPSAKLSVVSLHAQQFLQYMSERCDELFPDSSYVTSS